MSAGGKVMLPCPGTHFLCAPPTPAAPSDEPGLTLQGAGGQARVRRVPMDRPRVWEGQ